MGSVALLQSLRESIIGQAGVKTIFGEPITAQGKTVIPVAKLTYGYGAGAGTGGMANSTAQGEGGGGGGGVRAVPIGVIEVSDQQTRFIPITSRNKLAGAVLAGVVLGILLFRRKRR
ncbi:MAG TPA: spore germination protein GerW family protein [Silvibacterium sp.]|nr:spore germination protein GerW family protein [Silvibacterium sp.]